MFFRKPIFYFAPDAEAGASVAEHVNGHQDSDAGEGPIGDDDVAAVDAGGTAAATTADDTSLAARVQAAPDLSEVWKQHKLDGLPNDPQQLRQQYLAGIQAAQEREQYKNQLLWMQHQQMQQRARAPEPAAPAKVFNLPEFDQAWLNMVYTDENGNLVAKNGADPSLPMKIQAFAKAKEEAQLKLLQDPIGTLSQHLMPMIQQQAQAISQQQLSEYARLREIQNYEQSNLDWIYVDPKNPSLGITPAAQRWNQYHAEALQMRHPNPVQYATRALDADAYQIMLQEQAQQGQQAAAATDARAADKSFLKRAAAQSSRGGSLPSKTTPKPPQNANPKAVFKALRDRLNALPKDDLDSI